LILDEEGVYDPSTFNDRLLLGLKGTMSEAKLFVLRARLQGGILNKVRRGALKLVLPMGLCYTESDTVVLDPDVQVQATIREVFHRFEHTGSAFTTVRHFHQEHLLFPRRVRCGPHQGEIVWREIEHHEKRLPRTAGADNRSQTRRCLPRGMVWPRAIDTQSRVARRTIDQHLWMVGLPHVQVLYPRAMGTKMTYRASLRAWKWVLQRTRLCALYRKETGKSRGGTIRAEKMMWLLLAHVRAF
jgi:hypothetical protein